MRGSRNATIAAAALAVLLGACSEAGETVATPEQRGEPRPRSARERSRTEGAPAVRPPRVDPREGGFEIVLGEWALTPEAPAIRPGRVTFVVHNRGTMGHGFEMELEGDSSGPGSGDLFEAEGEVVQPGESARMTVSLAPGVYEIECLVDGHDDMGMEGVLKVRRDAPLLEAEREPRRPGRISIAGFAFGPPDAAVPAGTEVVWTNRDPADHTVTSGDGSFGSNILGAGESFSHRFDERGTYEYRCAIHPGMTGQVTVE